MPSIKRDASAAPDSTGFESYDGPNPPLQQRMYRGVIEHARVREASTGRMGFNILVKFQAKKGDPESKYDGYPAWVSLWLSDKEPNMAREKAFYRAVGVPDDKLVDVNVVHDDLDDGGAIKKVGGRKIVGRVVKVDMQTERYGDELQLRGDAIYPAKDGGAGDDPDEGDPDADLLDDATNGDEGDDEYADPDEREEELAAMPLPALRKLAKGDYDIDPKGKNKAALVAAILEHEFDEGGDDEGEEGDDDDALPDYTEVSELTLPKLRAWALENGEYEKDDLKGLSKAEILEMLVDDEVVSSNEPAF